MEINNDITISTIFLGFIILIIGIALIVIGSILSFSAMNKSGEFGGLILIGPIPIAFGSSPTITAISMAIGLAIIILYIVFYLAFLRRR